MEDLFLAHISGMDTLARGLRNVAKLIEVRSYLEKKRKKIAPFFLGSSSPDFMEIPQDGSLDELIKRRYRSFDTEFGAQIEVLVPPQ